MKNLTLYLVTLIAIATMLQHKTFREFLIEITKQLKPDSHMSVTMNENYENSPKLSQVMLDIHQKIRMVKLKSAIKFFLLCLMLTYFTVKSEIINVMNDYLSYKGNFFIIIIRIMLGLGMIHSFTSILTWIYNSSQLRQYFFNWYKNFENTLKTNNSMKPKTESIDVFGKSYMLGDLSILNGSRYGNLYNKTENEQKPSFIISLNQTDELQCIKGKSPTSILKVTDKNMSSFKEKNETLDNKNSFCTKTFPIPSIKCWTNLNKYNLNSSKFAKLSPLVDINGSIHRKDNVKLSKQNDKIDRMIKQNIYNRFSKNNTSIMEKEKVTFVKEKNTQSEKMNDKDYMDLIKKKLQNKDNSPCKSNIVESKQDENLSFKKSASFSLKSPQKSTVSLENKSDIAININTSINNLDFKILSLKLWMKNYVFKLIISQYESIKLKLIEIGFDSDKGMFFVYTYWKIDYLFKVVTKFALDLTSESKIECHYHKKKYTNKDYPCECTIFLHCFILFMDSKLIENIDGSPAFTNNHYFIAKSPTETIKTKKTVVCLLNYPNHSIKIAYNSITYTFTNNEFQMYYAILFFFYLVRTHQEGHIGYFLYYYANGSFLSFTYIKMRAYSQDQ
ncbi:hypothetical protein A3Q56_03776 [Intoshia linei]|uniref:Uncharacterized protein n=1 Tax=Intoshia linei TaxID=1819745 RepID=A0A177B425_9BILA|nr:hypothetical protein A3Q56_03776 [Intoshia linei]